MSRLQNALLFDLLLKAHGDGDETAVLKALRYCRENQVAMPAWLADMVVERFEASKGWRGGLSIQGRNRRIRDAFLGLKNQHGAAAAKKELAAAWHLGEKNIEKIVYQTKAPTQRKKR